MPDTINVKTIVGLWALTPFGNSYDDDGDDDNPDGDMRRCDVFNPR